MLILARVNGYYSSYSAQSVTEEEDRCFFGNVFTHYEKEFFKHRLQSKFYKITNDSVETALAFLQKQKMANCPCQVHSASRGYDWVDFRRQPDRIPTFYYEQTESESEDDDHEKEDDDYYSVEPIDIDDENKEDHTYCEQNPDVTGAASPDKIILPEDLDETSKKSEHVAEPEEASSIHSREEEEQNTNKKKTPTREEEDMQSEISEDIEDNMDSVRSKIASYVCFKPLMYYNRHQDIYYYYRYFKPYMLDHRLLTMGHDCGCPVRRLHKTVVPGMTVTTSTWLIHKLTSP